MDEIGLDCALLALQEGSRTWGDCWRCYYPTFMKRYCKSSPADVQEALRDCNPPSLPTTHVAYYAAQLAWWLAFFPPERFLILTSAQLHSPEEQLEVCSPSLEQSMCGDARSVLAAALVCAALVCEKGGEILPVVWVHAAAGHWRGVVASSDIISCMGRLRCGNSIAPGAFMILARQEQAQSVTAINVCSNSTFTVPFETWLPILNETRLVATGQQSARSTRASCGAAASIRRALASALSAAVRMHT